MIHALDDGAVRTLQIDRGGRKNAFDQEQYHGLATTLQSAADDDAVHVVVVTGTGDAFSAGQDLAEMAELAAGTSSGPATGFPSLLHELETFPKPLIAAVNGVAVGIGMTMLLHCDIVLVADTARMRVPFSELGVPPEAGSSVLFADVVGWQQAAELLFTSRWVTADEAVQMGLALRVFAAAELAGAAAALAEAIAARSPWAVQTAKRLLLEGRGTRVQDARSREDAAFGELFRSGRS
jgi:enoyl-CoA hydratase/carnithine racemase